MSILIEENFWSLPSRRCVCRCQIREDCKTLLRKCCRLQVAPPHTHTRAAQVSQYHPRIKISIVIVTCLLCLTVNSHLPLPRVWQFQSELGEWLCPSRSGWSVLPAKACVECGARQGSRVRAPSQVTRLGLIKNGQSLFKNQVIHSKLLLFDEW